MEPGFEMVVKGQVGIYNFMQLEGDPGIFSLYLTKLANTNGEAKPIGKASVWRISVGDLNKKYELPNGQFFLKYYDLDWPLLEALKISGTIEPVKEVGNLRLSGFVEVEVYQLTEKGLNYLMPPSSDL